MMICQDLSISTLVLLERNTSHQATFPLEFQKRFPSVPRHRQAGKIQSSKIIHLEVSIFQSKKIWRENGRVIRKATDFCWIPVIFCVETVETLHLKIDKSRNGTNLSMWEILHVCWFLSIHSCSNPFCKCFLGCGLNGCLNTFQNKGVFEALRLVVQKSGGHQLIW